MRAPVSRVFSTSQTQLGRSRASWWFLRCAPVVLGAELDQGLRRRSDRKSATGLSAPYLPFHERTRCGRAPAASATTHDGINLGQPVATRREVPGTTLCSCELNFVFLHRKTISSFDVHGAARRTVEYVGSSTVSPAPVAKVTPLRQYRVNLTPHTALTALHHAFYNIPQNFGSVPSSQLIVAHGLSI